MRVCVGSSDIAARLLNFIVLVLSLTVPRVLPRLDGLPARRRHRRADGTAHAQPAASLDLFGTVILPLLNAPIGWAKPVPVNPANFRRDVPHVHRRHPGEHRRTALEPRAGARLRGHHLRRAAARRAPGIVERGTAPACAPHPARDAQRRAWRSSTCIPVPPLDGEPRCWGPGSRSLPRSVGAVRTDRSRSCSSPWSCFGPVLWRVIGPPIDYLPTSSSGSPPEGQPSPDHHDRPSTPGRRQRHAAHRPPPPRPPPRRARQLGAAAGRATTASSSAPTGTR